MCCNEGKIMTKNRFCLAAAEEAKEFIPNKKETL
jgi:hypothetical protein